MREKKRGGQGSGGGDGERGNDTTHSFLHIGEKNKTQYLADVKNTLADIIVQQYEKHSSAKNMNTG